MHMDEDSGPPPRRMPSSRSSLPASPLEMVYHLLLVMYLGRGDFGTADLAEHFEQIKTTFGKPEWAISQMMGKAQGWRTI